MKKLCYKIVKKGRKWFHALTADEKQYKAQIEINEVSENWAVGEIVEFTGEVDFQHSRYGNYTKVFVYPKSEKQLQDEKDQKTIEKWLGYVEENSDRYVYKKGVDNLANFTLSESQSIRLERAIKKGSINQIKSKMFDSFHCIEENLGEFWHYGAVDKLAVFFGELMALGVDTAKYQKRLKKLKTKHKTRVEENKKRYFTISCDDYKYFGHVSKYKLGTYLESEDGRIGKVIDSWISFDEEALNYTGSDVSEGCKIAYAKCDTYISEEEKATFLAEKAIRETENERIRAKKAKKHSLRKEIDSLFSYIVKNGRYPASSEFDTLKVDGNILHNDFDIYGTGRKIVVGDKHIWALKNNSHDGDDWSRNNYGGTIAFCMEIDKTCKKNIEIINKYKEELE